MSVTDLSSITDYVALTAAYQDQLNALAELVGEQVAEQFRALDHLDRADVPAFVESSQAIVRAGQGEAIDLTSAWLAEVNGKPVARDLIDLRELAPEWERPFQVHWHELKHGQPWETARESGAGRAHELGFDSARAGAHKRMGSSKLKTVGYRRVPNATACDWCQVVAIQRYHSAESASLSGQHKKCKCAVVAIFGHNDPGRTLAKQRLKELKASGAVSRVSAAGARSRK